MVDAQERTEERTGTTRPHERKTGIPYYAHGYSWSLVGYMVGYS
jgi:hypothetical protein